MTNITDHDAILSRLFGLRDEKYRDFQAKLTPTVPADRFIGVRVPLLRELSKELYGTELAESFINDLPHRYYDENNLHAFLIERIRDLPRLFYELERFLPYVDNWATCDSMRPKVFSKRPPELYPAIKRWLTSSHTYTVRFGIEALMNNYLSDGFDAVFLEDVASVDTKNDYYISMMVAWFFAEALVKQYDAALPYLERLDAETLRRTVQKACDSFRISPQTKEFLRQASQHQVRV